MLDPFSTSSTTDEPVRGVDIHCHCLPGVDDGPASLDEALALCRALIVDGFSDVIATPHQLGSYETRNAGAELRERLVAFQHELEAANIALRLHAGADVRIDDRLVHRLKSGEVLSLAGTSYVLLELPHELLVDISGLLQILIAAGYRPILTHPERHNRLLQRMDMLRKWRDLGVLVQLTAASVAGDLGRATQMACWRMMDAQLVDVIATDAHSADRRPPRMQAAIAAITQVAGPNEAARLCVENPRHVLRNEPLAATT